MSEEFKINIPLFNINEKVELENKLSFHLDQYVNEIMRTMTRDKDIIILKKVIEKQQAEIKKQQAEIKKQQKEINRLNDENELLKIITRQYNSYCINTDDDDEPRIILAHKHYFDSGVFTSNFISKDKIKEIFQFYIERDSLFNDNPHKMAVIRLKDVLEELLEEN